MQLPPTAICTIYATGNIAYLIDASSSAAAANGVPFLNSDVGQGGSLELMISSAVIFRNPGSTTAQETAFYNLNSVSASAMHGVFPCRPLNQSFKLCSMYRGCFV
jgi:hydroxyethylthiazole kinase-like sugar kinase family protein